MEPTIDRVRVLVAQGDWKASEHAVDEMDEDGILAQDVLNGVQSGEVLEDYPAYPKGPCVLVLQMDSERRPIHILRDTPQEQLAPRSS